MKKLLYISLVNLFFSCQRNEEASVWDDFYRIPYVISEKEVRTSAIIDSINNLYQAQVNEKEAHEITNFSAITNSLIGLPPPPFYSTKDYGSGYGNINIIFYKDIVIVSSLDHQPGFQYYR